jgi:hypothetical protein|tara:strand:+ start:642 stop:869 length:228 start_codon:yes stop_codon:yes gene_type:complete
MKTVATTDWNALLESKCTAKTMKAFAEGDASTRSVTQKLANSEHAGEFRKLVRENGTTYARRLARKALRYRGMLV